MDPYRSREQAGTRITNHYETNPTTETAGIVLEHCSAVRMDGVGSIGE